MVTNGWNGWDGWDGWNCWDDWDGWNGSNGWKAWTGKNIECRTQNVENRKNVRLKRTARKLLDHCWNVIGNLLEWLKWLEWL